MANLTDIERLNYYEGEFLGATDFQAEQEYHRDMRRRHNLGQHTWGIVTGLDLAQAPNGGTSPTGATEVDVYLQPGMAVDGFGREMVVLSQTQITPTMLAAFFSSSPVAPQWIYVWISYQQSLLQPSSDRCTSMNVSNAFGRIEETYTLSFTSTKTSQPNDPIVVDGNDTTPPSQSSSSSSMVTDPPAIRLPFDDSIPFQEFSTDDSSLVWWVCVGRVLWDPYNEVFVQIDPNPQKAATSAGTGREYACNVSAGVYAPAVNYFIADRATGYPMPPSLLKPPYGGVQAEIAGFLQVDCVLSVLGDALIGSAYDPTLTTPLSPLTVVANGTNEELIQFRNPSNQETWHICENLNGNTPGLNLIEINSKGNEVDGRIFVQPTLTSSSAPSTQNVGIGTMTPRNPLAIRANGSWEELLSFEDTTGTTRWHLNQNPQGKSSSGQNYQRGLNFCETQVNGDFRLFLEEGGNVGIGTPLPTQNLSVNAGLNIDQAAQNGGSLNPGLSFGSKNREGIASNQAGSGANPNGVDFYTAGTPRMSITNNGSVGLGTMTPQQNLSISAGLNIDQASANTGASGSGISPGLTFGSGSGEGIASNRLLGTQNNFGLDFYTDFALQMNVSQHGQVGIDQSNQNPGNSMTPGLVFGTNAAGGQPTTPGSGEGIASNRTTPGVEQYGLDFYTQFQLRMQIRNNGDVHIFGHLFANGIQLA